MTLGLLDDTIAQEKPENKIPGLVYTNDVKKKVRAYNGWNDAGNKLSNDLMDDMKMDCGEDHHLAFEDAFKTVMLEKLSKKGVHPGRAVFNSG